MCTAKSGPVTSDRTKSDNAIRHNNSCNVGLYFGEKNLQRDPDQLREKVQREDLNYSAASGSAEYDAE